MVRINTIYTRTGDDGQTSLIGGRRVAKNSLRVSAFGEVDELNAFIGELRGRGQDIFEASTQEQLAVIQNELFDIGAVLADDPQRHDKQPEKKAALAVTDKSILRLENSIDQCIDGLPELKSFVLPGGSPLNNICHLTRCVCRRAERSILALAEVEPVPAEILQYINRLSDYFFALARHASRLETVEEYLWVPGRSNK